LFGDAGYVVDRVLSRYAAAFCSNRRRKDLRFATDMNAFTMLTGGSMLLCAFIIGLRASRLDAALLLTRPQLLFPSVLALCVVGSLMAVAVCKRIESCSVRTGRASRAGNWGFNRALES